MALHTISRGLNLPIAGAPEQRIDQAPHPARVAVVARDYPGMKPTMHVRPGDGVRTGQLLFEDKKTPGVRFTSPGTGTVSEVNRGNKRALQTVVVQLDPSDQGDESVDFTAFAGKHPSSMSRDDVRDLLLESGAWTALRARPFGRIANPETAPKSIFVTATDSYPLAPDLNRVIEGRLGDFERGLAALGRLTDGTVFVCSDDSGSFSVPTSAQVKHERFEGKHPAGTAGVHIHTLDPVNRSKLVWWISLQDTLAIGRLFETGRLDVSRVISLAGPSVRNPRLLRTRLGASIEALTSGELHPDQRHRLISGSVLSGRTCDAPEQAYLGPYDQQVTVIPRGDQREFLGWMGPGFNSFSVSNLFLSKIIPGKRFKMNTSTNGSPRAIVPIGLYEKVNPLDIEIQFLLKSLVTQDIEKAEELGVLELVEEDVSLCTFVCPGKVDYGPKLRETLTTIEKEG